ncbi:PHD finger protein MALE MEIOCYTE DEATH 1-like [Phoenix dactylifera]|uniref:PHD finger protein MALE MEIOCYTE DEATH 1-like n=1 Tax=Phoenix dactylifera TaxID=42345 RepID=A0A8B7BIP5_PHODC|nr:PHD finger protein MALE MEIOCYTE DEATH 1-like [Phoenix dactylifera]
MPPAVVSDPTAKRKVRAKIYGLRTFLDPGYPTDFHGSFRDNVQRFLRECADVEKRDTAGMRTWCTLLVDERSGAVAPLFTVEESVRHSRSPFCNYCRCTGWSHHFVSKRRYHVIIPADDDWDRPLSRDAFHLHTHLLHGLLHCNGFGHLLCINGREGGSKFIPGGDLMDLFDRLCTALRARAVTVDDVARKRSMDLRLLLGVAHGAPWFSRWGYRFSMGSFGVTEEVYQHALHLLSTLRLDTLIADLAKAGGDQELRRVTNIYRKLRQPDRDPPILTVRDLLRFLLGMKHRTPPPPTPPPPPQQQQQEGKATSTAAATAEKRKPCRDFAQVAVQMASRWSAKRLRTAAQVIVNALREHGSMTRQEVRDAARLTIGDTGLLDFVLKSLGDCLVDGQVVRRVSNPKTRVLEFSLEEVPHGDDLAAAVAEEARSDEVLVWPDPKQVERDLQVIYRSVVAGRAEAARTVLDCKHWVKAWGLRDDADDRLRFFAMWQPREEEMGALTRPPPPPEVVVVEAHASVGELRAEAERALRDSYYVLEGFRAAAVEGIQGEEWDPVLLGGAESGSVVWIRGEGADMGCKLRYEGGADTWSVGCSCGARDDDGERMVACDVCDVWHHTRCIGIADGEPVPPIFLCARCGSSLRIAAEGWERP